MGDASKHFVDDGKGCKIHTTRKGKCPQGSCNHRTAVAKPFAETPDEAHHILCVSATVAYKDRYKSAQVEAIDAAYYFTPWCVNQAPNMIWLPLKDTYKNHSDELKEPLDVWRLNLPCHNQDHNCAMGYTDEVIDMMKLEVWGPLLAGLKKDPKECPTPEKMQAMFTKVYNHFRSELRRRGQRKGGTRAARKAQDENPQPAHWWLPFSMANDNVARHRKVATFGRRPRWTRGFVRVRP